jgi:chloride channel 3/4/5
VTWDGTSVVEYGVIANTSRNGSTDWIHDHIKEKLRLRKLRSMHGVRGHLKNLFDGAQAWILVTIIGLVVAIIAWLIDIIQELLTDWKDGFCVENWRYNRKFCCWGKEGSILIGSFVDCSLVQVC